MFNGQNVFDQPVKNDLRTYDEIQKIATGQGDDYIHGTLLDYNYFKEYYKMIAIDLSKQEALDADPKAMQEINFIGNLAREGNADTFSLLKKHKKNKLDFSNGTVKVL